jgi:hypothetical protein
MQGSASGLLHPLLHQNGALHQRGSPRSIRAEGGHPVSRAALDVFGRSRTPALDLSLHHDTSDELSHQVTRDQWRRHGV